MIYIHNKKSTLKNVFVSQKYRYSKHKYLWQLWKHSTANEALSFHQLLSAELSAQAKVYFPLPNWKF
jgi:frataxin-like iron-binding protein CyaY